MTLPHTVMAKLIGAVRGKLYRAVMIVAHRYGWHYAPKKPEPWPPMYPPEAGASFCWCQWCGLRGHVLNPTNPLRARSASTKGE